MPPFRNGASANGRPREEIPGGIRPYLFHGLDLDWVGRNQGVGECPWCGKEGKFHVNPVTGQADCKAGGCGWSGNVLTFLRRLWEESRQRTGADDIARLALGRGVLGPDTVRAWGVCRSVTTGDWLIPGYNVKGDIVQVYKYTHPFAGSKRRVCLPTPQFFKDKGTGDEKIYHGLHGVPRYDPNRQDVYIAEGVWDGMVLAEVVEGANVIAVPSCVVFPEVWTMLMGGKDISLFYDSDHPTKNKTGAALPPAGFNMVRRVAGILKQARPENRPQSVSYLRWGPDGYDPSRPSGYDVRDYLGQAKDLAGRRKLLGELLARVEPVDLARGVGPGGGGGKASSGGQPETDIIPCRNWAEVQRAWRLAMQWEVDGGLDVALSVILSVAASTMMVVDQLWMMLVSPPSTGKTDLCDGLATNEKYVKAVSRFSGLHSGYMSDKDGDEDHSLLAQIKGKTFIIKEGATLLDNPNRSDILAQIRDAYDTNPTVTYANKVKRDYKGWRFSFVIAGTSALAELDSAEMGARFLICRIMDTIDPDLEADICQRIIYRVVNNRSAIADGKIETQDTPEMTLAKRLTGGYVGYLRENAARLLDELDVSNLPQLSRRLRNLGVFTAYMRARPGKKQQEFATREMAGRICSQLTSLSLCLPIVMQKPRIDAEVIRRVRKVALDTCQGRTLDLTRHLVEVGEEGAVTHYFANMMGDHKDERTLNDLSFLQKIGAVERFEPTSGPRIGNQAKWRLTPTLAGLYQEVMRGNHASVQEGQG